MNQTEEALYFPMKCCRLRSPFLTVLAVGAALVIAACDDSAATPGESSPPSSTHSAGGNAGAAWGRPAQRPRVVQEGERPVVLVALKALVAPEA